MEDTIFPVLQPPPGPGRLEAADRGSRQRPRSATDVAMPMGTFVSIEGDMAPATSSRNRTQTDGGGHRGFADRPFGGIAVPVQRETYTEGGGTVVSMQGGTTRETGGTVVSVSSIQGSRSDERRPTFSNDTKAGSTGQMPGLYIAQTAVGVMACYLGIQLLITFEEVFLPFIFAVLAMVILEPLKSFVMRTCYRSVVVVSKKFSLKVCIEAKGVAEGGTSNVAARGPSPIVTPGEGGHLYGSLPDDSPPSVEEENSSEGMDVVYVPVPGVQKFLLVFSIIFCVLVTARVLWLTAKVFIKAGGVISADIPFYKRGADRCKNWVEDYVHSLNFKGVNWAHVLDELVQYVEDIASIVTKGVVYTLLQAVVGMIFLLYMLWSPVKTERNTTTLEVLTSTGRYLKVKAIISTFTGCCVGISLWAIGLDLPAAFGFLAFLCNFLPGIGSVVSSILPCVLAIIDVRKTPSQVAVAFLSQVAVHSLIDFVVEPVFFGISVEIHSVMVIIGIWFFYKVWGVAGMLLSVPLLAMVRLTLKSFSSAGRGRESETLGLMESILEGRWMSSVGDDNMDPSVELADFAIDWKDQPSVSVGEAGDIEEVQASDKRGIWGSHFGLEVSRLYQENRLPIDIVMLVGLVVGLTLFDV